MGYICVTEYRGAQVVVLCSLPVQIHCNNGNIEVLACLYFPANKQIEILGLLTDQYKRLLGVRKALAQSPLHCILACSIRKRLEVVSVKEVEIDVFVGLPSTHKAVRPHIFVTIEDYVRLVSIAQIRLLLRSNTKITCDSQVNRLVRLRLVSFLSFSI